MGGDILHPGAPDIPMINLKKAYYIMGLESRYDQFWSQNPLRYLKLYPQYGLPSIVGINYFPSINATVDKVKIHSNEHTGNFCQGT